MPSRYHSTISRRDITRADLAVRTLAISAASPYARPVAHGGAVEALRRTNTRLSPAKARRARRLRHCLPKRRRVKSHHAYESEHATKEDFSPDGHRLPPKGTFRHNRLSFPVRTGSNISAPGNRATRRGRASAIAWATPPRAERRSRPPDRSSVRQHPGEGEILPLAGRASDVPG